MPTKPIDDFIPRELDPQLAELLNQFSCLIEETVNFGSHVFKWCNDSAKDGDQNLVIFGLFRHILELIDSISINIKYSSIDPCKLLLRGILESYFCVAYILQDNTQKRAMAFLTYHVRQKIKNCKNLDITTEQGSQFHEKIKTDRLIGKTKNISPDNVQLYIKNLEGVLQKPEYQEASKEYDRLKGNPYWYSLYGGPKNIKELAEHLSLPGMYNVFYRQWSEATHSTDIIQGRFSKADTGGTEILQIRSPKDAQYITNLTISFALGILQICINHFAPEKIPIFRDWYIKELRSFYRELSGDPLIKVEG